MSVFKDMVQQFIDDSQRKDNPVYKPKKREPKPDLRSTDDALRYRPLPKGDKT